MSSYMQFFIRNDATFLPIGSYIASSPIYAAFDEYIPDASIKAISRPLLRRIYEVVADDITYYRDRLNRAVDMRGYIATMNNSMEEKMEWLDNVEATIDECNKDIKEAENVQAFTMFLDDILDEVTYVEHIDERAYLYGGIEVGNPTLEDIVR